MVTLECLQVFAVADSGKGLAEVGSKSEAKRDNRGDVLKFGKMFIISKNMINLTYPDVLK